MLRYTPMTEGYIFLPRAVRPEVKKYTTRSEVDHHCMSTEKEVCLPYNFDFQHKYQKNREISKISAGTGRYLGYLPVHR